MIEILNHYIDNGRKNELNGATHVKDICQISYDDALDVVNFGVEEGFIVRDKMTPWFHKIVNQL